MALRPCRPLLLAIYLGMMSALLVTSCAGVGPAGGHPADRDWTRVIPVNTQAGVYFDLQTGRCFKNREFILRLYESAFSEGLRVAKSREDDRAGYIDTTGRVVIPFQYEHAGPFRDGRAYAVVGKRTGIIDKNGRWIVEPGQYDALHNFNEGRCAFRKGDRWGFLDTSGKVVLPPVYQEPGFDEGLVFREGLCLVKNAAGEKVYIDRNGYVRIRVPDARWNYSGFCEGLARVERMPSPPEGEPLDWGSISTGIRCGFMAKDGRMVIEPRYGTAGDFSEGLAPVTVTHDGSFGGDELVGEWTPFPDEPEPPPAWGFINTKGEVVIPMVYQRALRFHEGLAPVMQGGKWGYIDRQGRMIIGAGFEDARPFCGGIAEVVIGEKIAYIDKSGCLIVRTDISGLRF